MSTYVINGRRYRKTAYQLKNFNFSERTEKNLEIEEFQDTPDVYEDEPAPGCLAPPPGLPVLKNKIKKAKMEKKEKEEVSNEPMPTEDDRIQVIGGKKWIASISVPGCFIGKLFGTNRRSLNSLENETQCRVKTPRRDETKPCEISSIVSLECVQRCLDRIEIFLVDARKNARVTHFIAFPCDQHEVQENFEIFKQMVLESAHFDESCKIPELFTKPSRLHLTLSVIRIFDESDMEKTKEAFGILEEEIRKMLNSEPLIADIQGIDMMNDDPSQVSVLYAKVGGAKVQEIANHVSRRLRELLEIAENPEDVKLHMTLMNARYVSQKEGFSKNKKFTFDATKILEDLKESYFGTFPLTEICLCPLNSNAPADKFYEKLAAMAL